VCEITDFDIISFFDGLEGAMESVIKTTQDIKFRRDFYAKVIHPLKKLVEKYKEDYDKYGRKK